MAKPGLQSHRRLILTATALAAVGGVGYLDFIAGAAFVHVLFYLPIVFLVAWFVGRTSAIAISAASALSWALADVISRPFTPTPPDIYLNLAMTLAVFLAISFIISGLLAGKKREDELLRFIVHDLRAPLANMLAGLDLLQKTAGDRFGETEQEIINLSLLSGNRMLLLINTLLDLSRLRSEKVPLQLSEVTVEELVEAGFQEVTLWAKEANVALQREAISEGSAVRADRVMATRILTNLLSNALRVSPNGSAVALRVVPEGPHMLAFSVIDEGPGIPRRWARRIFDRFEQVEARGESDPVRGGWGLAFCQLAVRLQGGRIRLESGEGKGTTVTFTLPRAAGRFS